MPSWNENSSLASNQIPRILWNTNVHNRVHNSPQLVPVSTHVNQAHALPFQYLQTHFNIIAPGEKIW